MKAKNPVFYKRRIQNILYSVLFLTLMSLLLGILSWLLFGNYGIFFFLAGGITLIILHPSVSHKLHLRIRGAREITPINAPDFYYSFSRLVERAELPVLPGLYYIPSKVLNAFSIGTKASTSIVLTSAIINYLDPDELQGVIAHEMGHIKNNDMWHLGLANSVHQLTSWLSYLGLLFLLFQVPLIITGHYGIAFLPVLIIFTAPVLSRLLLSALSRTREYDADIRAVDITGDVESYVSALKKLTLQPFRLFGFIVFRHTDRDNSSVFQTHPAIRQRIHRLEKLNRHEPGAPYKNNHKNPLNLHNPLFF
jgi:heat shock protein HtpX